MKRVLGQRGSRLAVAMAVALVVMATGVATRDAAGAAFPAVPAEEGAPGRAPGPAADWWELVWLTETLDTGAWASTPRWRSIRPATRTSAITIACTAT